MKHPNENSRMVGLTKSRIEALTDGIFAFAMTLLVTGMALPTATHPVSSVTAHDVLIGMYPDFVHYVIAFVTLAGFWAGHHAQYHSIRFIDRRLLWINISSLLFIALVPFSASLAGDYPEDTLAAMVFAGNLLIVGLLFYWQWSYASKDHRLIDRSIGAASIASGKKRNLAVPGLSVLAIILAMLNVPWSSLVYFLVPVVLWIIPSGKAD
ncbi:TMEM175 family protein [[Eubacterium] cellulosolvens]